MTERVGTFPVQPRPLLRSLPGATDLMLGDLLVLAGISLCLLFQLHLIFVQEINWDEFYFLSLVHDYQRGSLTKPLQTFHVLLFAWLPSVGNEIAQIEAARLVMLLCEATTAALIFGTARAFLSRGASLVAALAYLSAGYVLLHGASFRADPLAAFPLMLAMFLLARSRLRSPEIALIALAAAFAAMVTVKALFYAPALLAMAAWRLHRAEGPKDLLVRLGLGAAGAAMLFALFYFVHLSLLPSASTAVAQGMMTSAYDKTLLSAGLLPRLDTLLRGAMLAPVQTILLIAGGIAAMLALGDRRDRPRLSTMLVAASPLMTFLFYRNAFPYFVGFIFPAAMLLAGYAAERLAARKALLAALQIAMIGSAGVQYGKVLDQSREAQEEIVAAVHAIFPQPIAYIDRSSMIASFSKQGFFMSTWGLEDYRARGVPIFAEILRTSAPPLLIANSPALQSALGGDPSAPSLSLLPEDAAVLRDNYIHHWGALWVAGKNLRLGPQPTPFEIAIPGTYTVEADAPVRIDRRRQIPGSSIELGRGTHQGYAEGPVDLRLRWGDNLRRPAHAPSTDPIFRGF